VLLAERKENDLSEGITPGVCEPAAWRYVEFFTANISNPKHSPRLRERLRQFQRRIQRGRRKKKPLDRHDHRLRDAGIDAVM
jgi:hypothetical protein